MRLGVSRNMIDVKDRYFSLNRTLLIALGLWPYKTSKLVQFQLGFFYFILISNIIFQLTPFLTSKCTVDALIINLSVTPLFVTAIIKYNSFYVNKKTIKYLLEELQYICNHLENNEIVIIDKYGNIGKRYTVGLTKCLVISVFVMVVSQLCSYLAYSQSSVNMSCQHQQSQLLITEYFIDHERYSHLLLLHTLATLLLGGVTIVATGATLIVYMQHACGLFKVASFRLKRPINVRKYDNILINNNLMYKNIICAVDIHRKAMMYANTLISNFEMSFLFLIMCGVLVLSCSVFRIFQNLLSTCKFDTLLPFYFVTVGVTVVYMFIANIIGQQVINHNNDMFAAAYESPWYLTSRSVQRLVVLLLQRGNKMFGLNVGGLFIASLECFATLINASVSYFTVMYSTR